MDIRKEDIGNGYTDIFFMSFYLSIKYWNRRNVIYFVTHYFNGLNDDLVGPIMDSVPDFCCTSLNAILNLSIQLGKRYCAVLNFDSNQREIKQWIFNGIKTTKSKKFPRLTTDMRVMSNLDNFKQFYLGMKKDCSGYELRASNKNRKNTSKLVRTRTLTCHQCGIEWNKRSNKLKICGKCKMVHYCGKKCQKGHWKFMHRKDCKKFRKILTKQHKLRIQQDLFSLDLRTD
eukprot:98821_1